MKNEVPKALKDWKSETVESLKTHGNTKMKTDFLENTWIRMKKIKKKLGIWAREKIVSKTAKCEKCEIWKLIKVKILKIWKPWRVWEVWKSGKYRNMEIWEVCKTDSLKKWERDKTWKSENYGKTRTIENQHIVILKNENLENLKIRICQNPK